MALYLNFILGLLLSFILVANAIPLNENGLDLLNVTLPGGNMTNFNISTIQGYDPSFEWHDYSMVQLWMGKDKVTVGDTTGQDLYNIVSSLLDKNCPSSSSWGICNHIPNAEFTGRCLKQWPSLTVDCTTGIWEIKAVWSSETVRKALIHVVAGALGGITAHEVGNKGGNCFMMGARKACNVGDVVRVHLPPSGDTHNSMMIRLYNPRTHLGEWDCCQGDLRQRMDKPALDAAYRVRKEFPAWWEKEFKIDSRCIIDGWEVCS